MACPDPRTRDDPGSAFGAAADGCFGVWSAPTSDPAVLAAVEAAAREIAHNGRRRDIRRHVRSHRQRLRARGLRPVQFWLPDLRRADAQEQARCQSRAVTWSDARSLATPLWSAPEPGAGIARGELRVLLDDAPLPASFPMHLDSRAKEDAKEDGNAQPQIVAILLDNAFAELTHTLVCPLTSRLSQAPLLRVDVSPSAGNGLRLNHQLMLDGLTTVPRQQLGACLGQLSDDVLKQLGLALLVVSGLAR